MQTLFLEQTSPYLIIRFESPKYRNSFGLNEVEQFQKILKQYKNLPLIFYSSLPNTFSSGGNLKQYKKLSRIESIKANRKIRKFLEELKNRKELNLAIINGDALGGGLEVLSAFDHIISTPHSLFAFWQRKISLSFGWLGGKRLKERMGIQNLKKYSSTTNMVDAQTALQIGLIDQICIAKNIDAEAHKHITKHLSLPKKPFPFLKNYLEKKEVSEFEKLWGNKEHSEILKKF